MSKYTKKPKRQYGSNAVRTCSMLNSIKNATKCDEDTILRIEIHGAITSFIEQGISKEEIIKKLKENSRYLKYEMYFENWIEDKKRKMNKNEKER